MRLVVFAVLNYCFDLLYVGTDSTHLNISDLFSAVPGEEKVFELGKYLRKFESHISSSRVYIRNCYETLFELFVDRQNLITNTNKRVILTGTPGIGKSLFLLYCAYRLVVERKATVILALYGKPYMLLITSQSVRRITEIPWNLDMENFDWYYLADTREPEPCSCKLTLLVVSPRLKFANEYSKDATKFYMPLWEWEEFCLMLEKCRVDRSLNEMKHCFDILGGVPRKLLSCSAVKTPESIVDEAIAMSSNNLKSLYEVVPLSTSENTENIAHTLILRSTNDYFQFELQYASRYVAAKVYKRLVQYVKKEVYKFIATSADYSIFGGIRGSLYEHAVHEFLVKGGTFKRLQLKPSEEKSNKCNVIIPSSDATIESFGTLNQAYPPGVEVIENTYFRPKASFEAVDSWKHGVCMFQITVARKHDLKKNLYAVAKLSKTSTIYFVVADENRMNSFRYVEPVPPASPEDFCELTQYVLHVPLSQLQEGQWEGP